MKLAYNSFGKETDKEIIILHGLFGSKRNWFSIAKSLAHVGNKVWVLDLRNHGETSWSESHSYFDIVRDIKNFIDVNNIKKACHLGHSMGGKAAMLFDLLYPNLASELIIVDIAPVKYSSAFRDYLRILSLIDVDTFKTRSQIDQKISNEIKDPNIRSFLLQNIRIDEEGVLNWRINLDALINNSSEISDFPELDTVSRTKALFLYGSKSEYSVYSHKERIENIFLNAFYKEIKDVGHWVHAEKPKEFIEIVTNFLKSTYTQPEKLILRK